MEASRNGGAAGHDERFGQGDAPFSCTEAWGGEAVTVIEKRWAAPST